MKSDLCMQITNLRICVAFLGEKEQSNWWSSSFLSASGKAFLSPVFPKSCFLAQVNGASSAARVVHDKDIGIGDTYHLFRLPESVEQEINSLLLKDELYKDEEVSEKSAYSFLRVLSGKESHRGVGPLLIKQSEINGLVVSQMAAAYLSGFERSEPVYPYCRGLA